MQINTSVLPENHKAGFVSIIGQPNVGKSSLMNAMVGERLSIITSKAQTTRHRIFGILNADDFQIVYSDTPGILKPKYELQRSMMSFVNSSLQDADVILFVTDTVETFESEDMLRRVFSAGVPVWLVINKAELKSEEEVNALKTKWMSDTHRFERCFMVSALKGNGVEDLLKSIVEFMPVHPPYFDKEEITDRSERFFASEIIREKLLLLYDQEVPYSAEVVINSFKEKEDIIVINSYIYVERVTQRAIIIGHHGERIKKLGIEARKELEQFFGKKIFLETHIKVEPDWRNKPHKLNHFGYSANE